MKRSKRIISLLSAVLAMLMLFSACTDKPADSGNTTNEGVGGSDIYSDSTTQEPTTQKPLVSSTDKLIALTFDDGPRAATTNRVLDILESNNSRATFFVVGYNIEDNVSTLKRAKEMGCEIGNHTNDHKILTKCSAETLRFQVDNPNQTLKTLLGEAPKLFRAPGGAIKGIKEAVGMPLIQWSIDTEDWKAKDAAHKDRTPEQRALELNRIARSVIDGAEKGDIVLMHDIYDFTADLCELVIPGLIEKGFKLVTVSEMFEAYGEKLEKGVSYSSVKFNVPANASVNSTQELASGNYIVKTGGSPLNLRSQPDAESNVLEKIPNGTSVTVSKSVPGWAYVVYNSAYGWVSSTYLFKAG